MENAFLERLGRGAELYTRNRQTVPESGNEGGIGGERDEILLTETQKEKSWTGAFVFKLLKQWNEIRTSRSNSKAPFSRGNVLGRKERGLGLQQGTPLTT